MTVWQDGMQPIISIVGKSDSGKTTLLEGLIAELKRRGHKLAVMKHSAEDFELDAANKDTWRFSHAGSEVSAISSGHNLAVFKHLERDFSPIELSHFVSWDCDLVLTEGFKQSDCPKIEVHRKEQGAGLVSPPHQLLGVVTDEPLEVDAPQFSKDEFHRIVDLIEQTTIAQHDEIDLFINDNYIPINPSFRNLLTRTLMAMVSGLKNVEIVKRLHLSLRRKV